MDKKKVLILGIDGLDPRYMKNAWKKGSCQIQKNSLQEGQQKKIMK